MSFKKTLLFSLVGLLVLIFVVFLGEKINLTNQKETNLKLYWFIPDGVRADPDVFTIFKWAEEGKLPNLKKMMDSGTYGYSKPVFPSHTPSNFATLLTGTYPEVHGVNDGPMRTIGKPLNAVAVPGFRSIAKKVPPIWTTLEENGLKVSLLSMPGSTPPEIQKGEVFRGRWGGWGADFQNLIFESKGNLAQRMSQGLASRLFYFGPQLTEYIDNTKVQDWKNPPKSFSEPIEIKMVGWGGIIYGYIYDRTDDNIINYDRIAFSKDKQIIFSDLGMGDWSNWESIILKWKTTDYEVTVDSDVKLNLIKLNKDGFFRIRVLYSPLNDKIVQPPEAAAVMEQAIGPEVDFVDNFPAQLGYYPEDKKTFIDEMNMSFDWHTRAISALTDNFSPDVVIHDIYSPTTMLCSHWWTGFIDPTSLRYQEVTDEERAKLWNEVKDMYAKLDTMLGEIMKKAGPNTYVVFSSDHGVIPQSKSVYLNNLFAKKGWLKFTIDEKTGESTIDWENSKVVYLQMAHVYINPKGLAGNYERASGKDYEALRSKVIGALSSLVDSETGIKPVTNIVKWEDVQEKLHLMPERAGDLVIVNAPNYGWSEKLSYDLNLFGQSLATGYKQALDPDLEGLMTPFVIVGPGVKKNNFLGDQPINHIDQYPTIFNALKIKTPDFVQGKILPIFNKGF